jgi:hypothetical protein
MRDLVRSRTAWGWAGVVAAVVVRVATGGHADGTAFEALAAGDCMHAADDGSLDGNVAVIACTVLHNEEVVGTVDLPPGPWAGEDGTDAAADSRCSALFTAYVGVAPDDSALSLSWYAPTEGEWANGDRHVVCTVETLAGSTDSVRAAKR